MHQQDGVQLPQLGETVRTLGLPSREVRRALRMLARLGFLSIPDQRHHAEYVLAEGHERFLEGLGFSFHTVTLDTGERFGVP